MSSARFSAQFFLCFTHFTPLTIICLRLHVDGKWRIIEIWVDFKAIAKIELERSGESGKNGKKRDNGKRTRVRGAWIMWFMAAACLPNASQLHKHSHSGLLIGSHRKKSNPPNRRKIWNKIRRTSYVKCVCKYVCQETFREGFLFPSLRTRVFPTGYSQTSIIHMLVGILFILFFFFFAKFVASMDTQRTSAFCHGAPSAFFGCFLCCFVSG